MASHLMHNDCRLALETTTTITLTTNNKQQTNNNKPLKKGTRSANNNNNNNGKNDDACFHPSWGRSRPLVSAARVPISLTWIAANWPGSAGMRRLRSLVGGSLQDPKRYCLGIESVSLQHEYGVVSLTSVRQQISYLLTPSWYDTLLNDRTMPH